MLTFVSLAGRWESVEFNHPFSFDALALDYHPELKQVIIHDLDKFISRKEFYNKVEKPWKRGYLLYGPPGTGKSSLVAAMANYLSFDIYDLQLGGVKDDATLRDLMLSTKDRSILVIEDIDCIVGKDNSEPKTEVSLSGLLDIIDGLCSSCEGGRIIVFTTNEWDKLDPELIRPGGIMDMHIHVPYLTMPGFRVLVKNYLDVTEEHSRFKEIEQLLETANVTAARVAEELMRCEDADGALSRVVKMLKERVNEVGKKEHDDNEG